MGQKKSSEKAPVRILTLGTQACGKSTFHKQMRLLFSGPFSEDEKKNYSSILKVCLISGIKHILDYCEDNNVQFPKKIRKIIEFFQEMRSHTVDIDAEVAEKVKQLYADKAFRDAKEAMGKFEYTESLSYVVKNLDRFVATDFLPTDADIIIARQRTTGLAFTKFQAYKNNFTLVDVGGEAFERRKWVHAEREEYHAIIFFVSLDDFDVKSDCMDGTKLEESLAVWEDVMAHQCEPLRPIVLFLNKKDRFAHKIKKVSAQKYIPGYKGPDGDYNRICKHIADMFYSRLAKSPIPRRGVYVKTTCMTDSTAMKYIFEAFYDFMVKRSLTGSDISSKSKEGKPIKLAKVPIKPRSPSSSRSQSSDKSETPFDSIGLSTVSGTAPDDSSDS